MAARSPSEPGRTGQTPRKGPRWGRAALIVVIAAAGAAVLGFGALALGTPISEKPTSCIVCHDMSPYYEAWRAGPHARSATCVDCHVDGGVVAHWVNSVVALREVAGELAGTGRFPKADVVIPSRRCLACHPTQKDTLKGTKFSHATHAAKDVACSRCHIQTGHAVSTTSLAAAGALDAARSAELTMAVMPHSQAWALPGRRPLPPAHPAVVCWACHDVAKVGCKFCHTSEPHETASTDCARCHQAPPKHFGTQCSQCHRIGVPFKQATFEHSASMTDCANCHRPPADHFGASCSTCHRPGIAFKDTKFAHPAVDGEHTWQSFPCKECHPAGFSSTDCHTCHARRGVD